MKRIIPPIALIFVLFLAYIFIDYFNIPSFLGIITSNVNIELLGTVFNAIVVITLYVTSYYYIDSHQIEKDLNARNTINALLLKTYSECLENLKLLDNAEYAGKYIFPKVDRDKLIYENPVINNLQNWPFFPDAVIMSLATNGHMKKEQLKEYLAVKTEYQQLVNQKIIFYDLTCPQNDRQKIVYDSMCYRDRALKVKLNEQIDKLKESS